MSTWYSAGISFYSKDKELLSELEDSVQDWIDDDESYCILEEFMDVRPEDV